MISIFIKFLLLCMLMPFVQAMEIQEPTVRRYDLTKLRFYDTSESLQYPCLIKYERGGFQLHYIAANHAFGKGEPVFKMIQDEIEIFQPDIMILEGFQQDQIEGIVSVAESPNEGEPIFALRRAREKNIKVLSGEPTNANLMEKMHSQFRGEQEKSEDVLVYYILRRFQQELRRGNLNQIQTTQEALESIINLEESFIGEKYSYGRLMRWLKDHKVDDLKPRLSDLVEDPQTQVYITRLQEDVFDAIRKYDMYFRDQHILTQTLNARYEEGGLRILAVYGGDHYLAQRDVLAEHYDLQD